MFLARSIQNFDRGLRFGFEPAGIGFTVAGVNCPKLIVRFDGSIWIQNLQEYIRTIARTDASQVRADLAALPVKSVTDRTVVCVNLLPVNRIAALLRQRQLFFHDFSAVRCSRCRRKPFRSQCNHSVRALLELIPVLRRQIRFGNFAIFD